MTTHTRNLVLLAIGIAVLIALPQVVKSSFALDIFIRILLFSFIGVAWNLMGGYAKQLSLGHAAYFGLGAYTSTILQIDFGISPWIGMIAGGVVAMLASLPIGWLCFRLRGPYFTIATIATAQALMLIFLKFRDLAWGAEGTTIPNLGSAPLMMQFETKASYYYVVLGLLAVGLAITWLIERSWMGYYLVAIGEDEDAAEAIGVNAPKIKRDIYLISSFLTALAGTFYIQYIYFIDPPTAFSFNISIEAAAKLARQFDRRRAAHRVQPDPDGGDPVAADRADGPDGRGLAALRRQTGAGVRSWQTHSSYVVSASASADCAPCKTSVLR
jgi:branched-chain amino acid transport system permease protein